MTVVERDSAQLLEPLRRELAALGCSPRDLRPYAAGLEFAAFRMSWNGADVVAKTPWTREIANDNDNQQDARDLLRQEAALLAFARSVGAPAPEVAFLHVDGDVDVLVTSHVPHDGSQPDADALASALVTLHSAPAPDITLVAQPGEFATVVAERLVRRAHVVEQLGATRLQLPPADELAAAIGGADGPPSVLHLDVRNDNVLTRQGRITALIDWTNALLGDPAMELARIAEYGSAPPGFFAAYEAQRAVGATRTRDLLYRLDTAVMLSVVMLSEAPNPRKAPTYVARATELAGLLRDSCPNWF